MAAMHPDFAGEVAVLPTDTRIRLIAIILEQEMFGPFSMPLVWRFYDAEFPYSERYFALENYTASFEGRALRDGFQYAHISCELPDEEILSITKKRLIELGNRVVEPVDFEEFYAAMDAEERSAANAQVERKAARGYHHEVMLGTLDAAREEMCRHYNLSRSQLKNFEARMDYFFKIIDEKCHERGMSLTLNINCNGPDLFVAKTLNKFTDSR